MEEGRGY